MNEKLATPDSLRAVETVFRDELSRGDATAQTVLPILRHLIGAEDNSVFSDEILARVRGMVGDLARQLLDAVASTCGSEGAGAGLRMERVAQALLDNPQLLAHVHSLALEWQLTERLQHRLALDPVVSPLLQALISAADPATQDTAMRFLAAQARWCQAQRRMTLALVELPAEILHAALMTLGVMAAGDPRLSENLALVQADVRARYDEGASRLGLAAHLLFTLGGGVQAALSLDSAGLALFLTALGFSSGQDREQVVFSTHESQLARLALALRASGLKSATVEREFLAFHPDITLPEGFEAIGVDRAAALLAAGEGTR
ncbi:hypothetical protein MTR62_00155 [Novosphingobium sp. 1949]|uniref:DUF2336 domain-containing protein n=1 Tax=Novosphingobium organovorum TaxID=2930092 RepID=A0ABT0B7W8_9SPHN|nr:hypothetical protein [Novosphingobium organovorum]MCJ2181127.1 hypothetical protein [Novosphingobium organovorum]